MTRQEREALRAAKVAAIDECRQDPHPEAQALAKHIEKWPLRAFAPIHPSPAQRKLLDSAEALQRDPDFIDVHPPTRENAAQRLVSRMRNPVHRSRWPRVRPALQGMAEDRRQSPQQVLAELTLQALWGGIDVLGPFTPGELPTKGMRALKARINAEVTADVLGPGWRQRHVSLDSTETVRRVRRRTAANVPGPDARLVLDQLVKKAGLTRRERELVDALRAGADLSQAAMRLGIAPPTARVLWSRARKKLART